MSRKMGCKAVVLFFKVINVNKIYNEDLLSTNTREINITLDKRLAVMQKYNQ